MDPFRKSISDPIPADQNCNPVALLAGQVALGVVVPIGVVQQLDGSYAVQTVVGTASAALAGATLVGPLGVTGLAVEILPADPLRKRHSLTNTGAETIYLGFDTAVTTADGIPVAAAAAISFDPPGVAYTGAVYGICGVTGTSEIRGVQYF